MDSDNNFCKCGKAATSIYLLDDKEIYLCDNCKKIFDNAIEVINSANIKKEKEVQAEFFNQINNLKKEISNENKKEVDQKYISQYSNLLSFDLSPKQIYNELNKHVVGQDESKKKLSVAIRRHYKRISARIKENWDDEWDGKINANNLPKENILLIGPTGCGKTYTCKKLSEIVSVPFWTAAMTAFTEDGYVGESVESLISSLIRESGYYLPLAECGMLFLDEIDKKAMKSVGNPSITRDVSGEGVQSAILDMIDTQGSIMNIGLTVGNRRHSQRYTEKFNTRDILFILGGAFPGLVDIIRGRMKGKKSIGFNANYNLLDKQKSDNEILHSILPEDIINYGFLPELVGRLGLITVLDPLTKEDMLDILLSTENSIISQQKSLAELENFKIEFTEEAINAIVDKAVQSGMGARRLKSIVSSSTEQIFFDLSGQRRFYNKVIRILEDTINDPSKYEIVKKQAKVKDNIIKDNEVKDNVKEG